MADSQIATIGGGCFWCVEAVFEQAIGVHSAVSGYMGGKDPARANYKDVCSGTSGYAEVVQITFDPDLLTYEELLTIFMTTHDPTTLNRQGADRGTQYRSVIFTHNDEQGEVAKQVIATVQSVYDDPIVTKVAPAESFYKAEEYHQGYYSENPMQPYCFAVIQPKVTKFRKMYAHKLK